MNEFLFDTSCYNKPEEAQKPFSQKKRVRYAIRNQVQFTIASLDDLIPEEHRVRDVWEYDLKTQCWRLIDLFDAYFKDADVQAFIYKNKIRIGYSAILNENKPLFVEVELP